MDDKTPYGEKAGESNQEDVVIPSNSALCGVMCGACGLGVNESTEMSIKKRSPCPNCRSTTRRFNLQIIEEIKPLALIDVKKKSPGFPGKKKLRIHIQKGDQINHDTGGWVMKERIINKEKQPETYLEHVVDGESGKVIHHDEGPLTEHQGHGMKSKIDLKSLQVQFSMIDMYQDSPRDMLEQRIMNWGKICLKMYQEKGHGRPHFHLDYGKDRHAASYSIDTFERLDGTINKKYEKTIMEWGKVNREKLLKIWNALQSGISPSPFIEELSATE